MSKKRKKIDKYNNGTIYIIILTYKIHYNIYIYNN